MIFKIYFIMKQSILIVISFFILTVYAKAQTYNRSNAYRIMFYNCENFFDVYDDSLKLDDQFTPNGMKHWTERKYWTKVYHIAKVIIAVGGFYPPDIVGLCEVENRYVLEDLIYRSPISKFKYKIIHYESPDRRGIDVAMLYLPKRFVPDTSMPIRVIFPEKGGRPTRDILYVKGRLSSGDTLHIFINHWPSRFGGHLETDPKRLFVAQLLRKKLDSIFLLNPRANIVIMGDLNDFPTDISLIKGLRARVSFEKIIPNDIYNLSYYLQEEKGKFTHRFHGESGILDQIIVSGALLEKKGNLYTTLENVDVFSSPFLLEKDPDYPGFRTYRTYIGMKYHGGYSDHLPVYLDLLVKQK